MICWEKKSKVDVFMDLPNQQSFVESHPELVDQLLSIMSYVADGPACGAPLDPAVPFLPPDQHDAALA